MPPPSDGRDLAASREPALQADGPEGQLSESGVDVTLIRWMLSLTPIQRLEALQGFVDSVWALRHGRRS